MAARKCKQGEVVAKVIRGPRGRRTGFGRVTNALLPPVSAGAIRSGTYRPDRDFQGVDGIRVALHRVKGLTAANTLLVPFRFQVPILNNFEREDGFEHAKYRTLRLGERSRPDGTTLRTVPISTMFLDATEQAKVNFVHWPFEPQPQKVLRELRSIQKKGTPFKLVIAQPVVWGGDALVNMRVVMTTIRAVQNQGEPGVEYVDITFEEYLETAVERKGRGRDEDIAGTHKIKAGESLYEIAKFVYRSPSLWRTIAKANGIKGVSPNSAPELAKRAKKHNRRVLKIPGRQVAKITPLRAPGGEGSYGELT